MEIIIHQALVTIVDTEAALCVPGAVFSDLSDTEKAYLSGKIKRVLAKDKRVGQLNDSQRNTLLLSFDPAVLENMAQAVGEAVFEWKMKCGLHEISDLFLIDFRADGIEYLLILDQKLKNGYTHKTEYSNQGPVNRILDYRTILPENLGKEDRFLLYDWRGKEVFLGEEKVEYLKERKALLGELIFDLNVKPTSQEIFKTIEKSVCDISHKYDLELSETLPELKSAFSECEFLEPETVAQAIFEKQPAACQDFKECLESAGMKKPLLVDQKKLAKKDRTMKFVTESGIEIIIPASYLKRRDKVEIINNPDGTTSISIKNIEKLKNR